MFARGPGYTSHYVKSVRIRSYSGLHFPAFGLNTERYSVSLRSQSSLFSPNAENAEQNNTEYGHFLCSVSTLSSENLLKKTCQARINRSNERLANLEQRDLLNLLKEESCKPKNLHDQGVKNRFKENPSKKCPSKKPHTKAFFSKVIDREPIAYNRPASPYALSLQHY